MRRYSAQLAKIALLISAAAVVGCDDSKSADRRVQETVAESRLKRAEEGGAEAAQALLQKAAGEAEAGAATKAHVKALLGHAQVDAANEQISRPQGINEGNREIGRLLWEIG